MKNLFFLFAIIASLSVAGFAFYQNSETAAKLREAENRLSETKKELLQNTILPDSLQLKHKTGSEKPHKSLALLNEQAIAQLKSKGISNPEKDLLRSIQNTPRLLPARGILGGTMAYRELSFTNQFFRARI